MTEKSQYDKERERILSELRKMGKKTTEVSGPSAQQKSAGEVRQRQTKSQADMNVTSTTDLIQSFTTRAVAIDADFDIVVATFPNQEHEQGLEDLQDLFGPSFGYERVSAAGIDSHELVRLAFHGINSRDSLDLEEATAAELLEQVQIVVSHSPLSVESLKSTLNHLASVGGTILLITHPHITPIALLSYAGIDIFIRVERKVADRLAHHTGNLIDRIFEMMPLLREKKKREKKSVSSRPKSRQHRVKESRSKDLSVGERSSEARTVPRKEGSRRA